ncbi:MAG: hypothetical protein JKY62_00740 [Desulfocapsa sp.]|nr:hypothetical protein [Desulfocapsa sp.]
MSTKTENKDSRLLPILREGVAVVQMFFFKEFKSVIIKKHPDLDTTAQSMLAGAVTNELFGTHNAEEKFQTFRNAHQGTIEQELMSLSTELPDLTDPLADALRIQTLCDNQEGIDSSHVLKQADSLGLLRKDRDLPLPSAFMETVRMLGAQHKLIIPPVEIDSAEEQDLLQ